MDVGLLSVHGVRKDGTAATGNPQHCKIARKKEKACIQEMDCIFNM